MRKVKFLDLHCYHCRKVLARAHLASEEPYIDIVSFCERCTPLKVIVKPTPEQLQKQISALPLLSIPRPIIDKIQLAVEAKKVPSPPEADAPMEAVDSYLDEMNFVKFLKENQL